MKISKKDLYQKYITENLTLTKLSKHFKCSIMVIWHHLQKYNIYKNLPKRAEEYYLSTKFGLLQPIKYFKPNKSSWAYTECKCKCGKICIKRCDKLREDNPWLSCGCLLKASRKYKDYEEISGTFFARIMRGAKLRNLEFSITIKQIWDLFLKQNRKCALTGLDLYFAKSVVSCNHGGTTASLDRIDPLKGYIENNIQWIHKDINLMKLDFNETEFFNYCKLVTNYKKV